MTTSKQKKAFDADGVMAQLMMPRRTAQSFSSLEGVRRAFSLPASRGIDSDARMAMDSAFDSAGGFNAIYESLTQHAYELGQFPVTSFLGYGVLQQIAQQGMIRACVQTVADDMSRKWLELKGAADDDAAAELTDLIDHKYHLKNVFHQAIETCGYMGGALIYIDTGTEDLTLPLVISDLSAELEKGTPLKFVMVDPVNVSPAEYNATDPLRDDYMQPRFWYVLGKRVHHSRLLSIVENQPPLLLKPNYNFLGIPQAQILWDYVMHFNECRVYTANLLQKISLLVVQTDTEAVLSNADGIAMFDAKMEMLQRYRNNDSVFVCDKDSEAVSNVQTSIAGCTDIVRQALEMIAAINRTPAVKLLGISPSGFNATGESDLRNYYDLINSKQELHRDALQTCINAIQLAEFGHIDPALNFEFVPLAEDDKNAAAMTAQTMAGAWGQLLDRQVISAEEMRDAVKADPAFNLENLSDEMPESDDDGEQEAFLNEDPEPATPVDQTSDDEPEKPLQDYERHTLETALDR